MSDRTQGQPRIVPTRPGWWWADMSKWHGFDALPEPLEAYIEDGRSTFDGMDDGDPSEDQVTWLAPIPGPEVCAALARYAESVEMADSRVNGMSSAEIMSHFAASDALDAAIRAERGGAA